MEWLQFPLTRVVTPSLEVEIVAAVVKADPFLMNMGIDEAGDHILAPGIIAVPGRLLNIGGDTDHFVPLDGYIRLAGGAACSVYDHTVANEKIVHHSFLLYLITVPWD